MQKCDAALPKCNNCLKPRQRGPGKDQPSEPVCTYDGASGGGSANGSGTGTGTAKVKRRRVGVEDVGNGEDGREGVGRLEMLEERIGGSFSLIFSPDNHPHSMPGKSS